MGMERLLALMPDDRQRNVLPHVYFVLVGDSAQQYGCLAAEQVRNAPEGWRVQVNAGGGSFKAQFKRADKSGAQLAVVAGEDEVEAGTVVLKNLRNEAEQVTISVANLTAELLQRLSI